MNNIKDGKLVGCTISETVRYQFPREVLSEYPDFVFFVEEYFRWLEQEGNAYFATINLPNSLDIDRTVDTYLEFFRETYLKDVPVELFGVDRCESVQYIVDDDFESGLSYQCLCEGQSVRFFINPSETLTVGQYATDFLRAANWIMTVKVETTGVSESLHINTTHNGTDTFSQTYANIGVASNYEIDTLIEDGLFKLNITNNESVRLVIDINRAPSFTDSPEIGIQRKFLFDKLINDITVVKVTINDVVLDSSYYTISDVIRFCGEDLREFIIDESVPLQKDDVIVIEACEQREINQRLLMKNAIDLFNSKGSDESFRYLFRLLFNEEIEIIKPVNNILKTSDGKWESDRRSIRISRNGNGENFLFRRATIVKRVDGEDVFVGSFLVENTDRLIISNYKFTDLFISNVQGVIENSNNLILTEDGYIPEYRVVIQYTDFDGTEVSESEMIYPTLTDLEIVDGGSNYSVGRKINVVDDYTFKRRFISDGVTNLINTAISGNLISGETRVAVDPDGANTILTEGVDYELTDSSIQLLNPIPDGTVVEISLFSKGNLVLVTQTDGVGSIKDITVYSGGIGYSDNIVDMTTTGNGDADLQSIPDNITVEYDGRYLNTDGHLSSTQVLQDGFKNQAYSYIIKSSRTIDQYGDIMKRLLHPAGFIYFGEISLFDCLTMVITDSNYDVSKEQPILESASTDDFLSPRLGPRYRSFDEHKLRYRRWTESIIQRLNLLRSFDGEEFDGEHWASTLDKKPYHWWFTDYYWDRQNSFRISMELLNEFGYDYDDGTPFLVLTTDWENLTKDIAERFGSRNAKGLSSGTECFIMFTVSRGPNLYTRTGAFTGPFKTFQYKYTKDSQGVRVNIIVFGQTDLGFAKDLSGTSFQLSLPIISTGDFSRLMAGDLEAVGNLFTFLVGKVGDNGLKVQGIQTNPENNEIKLSSGRTFYDRDYGFFVKYPPTITAYDTAIDDLDNLIDMSKLTKDLRLAVGRFGNFYPGATRRPFAFSVNYEAGKEEGIVGGIDYTVGAPYLTLENVLPAETEDTASVIIEDSVPNTPVQTIYNELVEYFVETPDDALKYLPDGDIYIEAVFESPIPYVGNGIQWTLPYDIRLDDEYELVGSISGVVNVDEYIWETNTIVFDSVQSQYFTLTIRRNTSGIRSID